MIPIIVYPHNLQVDYIGLSTDTKPVKANKGAIFLERNTGDMYYWDASTWVLISTNVAVGMLGYRSSDATYVPARIDSTTNSLQLIDYAHHEIHSGSAFTCHFSQSAPTNIGEMTMVAFNTPNTTKWCHMFAEASSTAGSTWTIYEVADLAVDAGTQLAIYNRNRNSATLSAVTSIETIPVANKATSYTVVQAAAASLSTTIPIYQKYLGAAAAGTDTSGENRDTHEFVLKQNTQYAFVVANTSADDNTHNIVLNWYEHTSIA